MMEERKSNKPGTMCPHRKSYKFLGKTGEKDASGKATFGDLSLQKWQNISIVVERFNDCLGKKCEGWSKEYNCCVIDKVQVEKKKGK